MNSFRLRDAVMIEIFMPSLSPDCAPRNGAHPKVSQPETEQEETGDHRLHRCSKPRNWIVLTPSTSLAEEMNNSRITNRRPLTKSVKSVVKNSDPPNLLTNSESSPTAAHN